MKIVKPGEAAKLKAMIWGPYGHGKTRFIATAQQDVRTSPMLLMDFEGGTQSLTGLDIDVVKITSWQEYSEVYNHLANDKHKYRSVGLDSISETHVFALLHILEMEKGNRKDPDLLQQGDYGKASVQLRRLGRSFRDLDLHVFFTALDKEVVDPRVGAVKMPALAGQLATEIPAMFDVTAYLAITQDEEGDPMRCLLLNNYPKFRVKARTPWEKPGEPSVVPDEIDNPSVTSLLDVMGFSKETE